MKPTTIVLSALALLTSTFGFANADTATATEEEVAPILLVYAADIDVAEFESLVQELGGLNPEGTQFAAPWCCADCWSGDDCCIVCAENGTPGCKCTWYGAARCQCMPGTEIEGAELESASAPDADAPATLSQPLSA